MEKVLFDPGYSKHVSSFVYFNEQANLVIKALKTPQQKSFKFRQLLPHFSSSPKEIEGNSFYGRTDEELVNSNYLAEINYIIDFIEQYAKTLNYYRIKAESIDNKYKKTAEIYKEFLILNQSFINTKTTKDIKLPSTIKGFGNKDLCQIKLLIDATVTDGNFERLFETEIF